MKKTQDEKVVVTIRKCVQIGPDDWEMRNTSRVFACGNTVLEILNWVKSTGIKNPTISDVSFSEYDGENKMAQPKEEPNG